MNRIIRINFINYSLLIINSKMTWNIDLEIFKITIPSDNINWKDLTLTIKENLLNKDLSQIKTYFFKKK